MSRGRCRFGRFDLGRIPPGKRASALALQLPAWTPFSDSDYAIVWSEAGVASVWVWDRAALAAALSASGQGMPSRRPLPETLLRGGVADGLRLLRVLDGFEGQHWVDGQLVASRWWATQPDDGGVLAFQRDCGLTPQAPELLTVVDAPLAPRPWAAPESISADGGQVAAPELAAYGVLALALAVPVLYLAVDHLRLAQARHAAEGELARASERSQGVLVAREAALSAAEQVRAFQELQTYPAPLIHMMAVARALPESGTTFVKEWELNDGKLRILLASTTGEVAGGEHVRALEQTGLFTDVKILTQADPRQMAFIMQLKPQAALAMPESAAASTPVGALAQP